MPKISADFLTEFENPALMDVIAIPEAQMMWRLTRRTLDYAALSGQVASRKMFTGGTILMLRSELEAKFGAPVDDILRTFYKPIGD